MLAASSGVLPQEKMEIKEVSVPRGKVAEDTVYYFVNVKGNGGSWTVAKRYSQFEEFHTVLINLPIASQIPTGVDLPGKKMKLFVSHSDPHFIEERRCLLEAYLKRLVLVKIIASCDTFVSFMSSDKQETKAAEAVALEMPEDVEVTGVAIPATRSMSDHVLYQIDVLNSRKRSTFSKWTVLKRFGQFFEMDAALRASFADNPVALATLPPPPQRKAKLLFDHMDDAFVEQRRVLLENYLNRLMGCLNAVRNEVFLGFLGVSV